MKVQASTAPRTSRLTGRAEDLRPRDVTTATTPAVGAAAGRRPQTAGTGGPACRRGSSSPGSSEGKVVPDPRKARAGRPHGRPAPGSEPKGEHAAAGHRDEAEPGHQGGHEPHVLTDERRPGLVREAGQPEEDHEGHEELPPEYERQPVPRLRREARTAT